MSKHNLAWHFTEADRTLRDETVVEPGQMATITVILMESPKHLPALIILAPNLKLLSLVVQAPVIQMNIG